MTVVLHKSLVQRLSVPVICVRNHELADKTLDKLTIVSAENRNTGRMEIF